MHASVRAVTTSYTGAGGTRSGLRYYTKRGPNNNGEWSSGQIIPQTIECGMGMLPTAIPHAKAASPAVANA